MTTAEFVTQLATKLHVRLPADAVSHLASDPRVMTKLQAFASVVAEGLDAVTARRKTADELVVELKSAKTAIMAVLERHHRSIEAVLAQAVSEVEVEARLRAGQQEKQDAR